MKRWMGLFTLSALLTVGCSAKDAANPKIEMVTSKGTIVLELYPKKAPITVENFLKYVEDEFFDGLIFHRVIKGFMIQGGGFSKDLKQKGTRDPIKLETGKGLSNLRGTIAMARTGVPDSATSQFFINHVDNPNLDSYGGGYAVFGKVLSGLEVVDAIAGVKTGMKAGMGDVPLETVTIESVRVLKAEK